MGRIARTVFRLLFAVLSLFTVPHAFPAFLYQTPAVQEYVDAVGPSHERKRHSELDGGRPAGQTPKGDIAPPGAHRRISRRNQLGDLRAQELGPPAPDVLGPPSGQRGIPEL